MPEPSTIARPYARAAFQSARDADALSGWGDALAGAAAVVQDPAVSALIGNPRVQSTELTEFVLGIASTVADLARQARVTEELRNFLALLAHNRRLRLLPQIASQFAALRAEEEHIANVEVLSARDLTSEQSHQLRQALERRLGRAVRLHARVEPALIGGAMVRYGDFVLDGSLRRSLERMASEFSAP